jgi:hypothetical protein
MLIYGFSERKITDKEMGSNKLTNGIKLARYMIQYNLRIIFANRFIWFLAGAIIFYLGVSVIYALTTDTQRMDDLYGVFIFPGLLLVFYPSVFGIQNDQDARTIEILFGIPDYRYKVWLVRIILIFIITYIIMIGFAFLSSILIVKFRIIEMSSQVMVPVLFMGMLAFMTSTIVRNGNGTAVVLIIIGVIFMMLQDPLRKSMWNVFLNPFQPSWDVNEATWALIALKNRIFLLTASVIFLLTALLNLQKREKFM